MPQLVITATGPDRPGLVGELTGLLFTGGANLADSRMVNLRGQFALIALIEGEAGALAALQASLPGAAKAMGLVLTPASQVRESSPPSQVLGIPYSLKTYSTDQPGLVHRITDLLRRHGINIEDLQTRLESAPFAGTALATLEVKMHVPVGLQVKKLRRDIEDLCDDLNCDFDFEPA